MSSTNFTNAPLNNTIACAPDNGRAYFIETEDGISLRVGLWPNSSDRKGTIFFLLGRADFLEKLGHTVSELHGLGYSVCALEFRGLGLSQRITNDPRAGHIEDFGDYQKDVSAFISAAIQLDFPKPWNIVANSMGGCVALRYAINSPSPFSAYAFTSPMWGIKLTPLQKLIAPAISTLMCKIGLSTTYAPGKSGSNETLETSFADNDLTNDAEMYTHLIKVNREVDDAWIGGPTIGWLNKALQETNRLSKVPSPKCKAIILSAECDTVVDNNAILHRINQWPSAKYQPVKAAKHDLLRSGSKTRREVLNHIVAHFEATE